MEKRYLIVLILACLYLFTRFYFTAPLDALGPYASYIYEILLIIISATILWQDFKKTLRFQRPVIGLGIFGFATGFLFYKLAGGLGITVPFSFQNPIIIMFLLGVAPVLEELLFRFFIWKPIEQWSNKLAYVWTTVIFSYSHLHAIWFIPDSYHSFVWYQAGYTLVLGIICGQAMYRSNSLIGAIIVHFLFNLGFFLAGI